MGSLGVAFSDLVVLICLEFNGSPWLARRSAISLVKRSFSFFNDNESSRSE